MIASGHAKDNAVASMAKILKYQGSAVAIEATLAEILIYLPLRYDQTEARFTHDLVADLCTLRPDLVVQYVPQVVKIFSGLLETKFLAEETTDKVRAWF